MSGDQASEATLARQREHMVREQLERRGISDPRVLDAMRTVPRHYFIPAEYVAAAYEDSPQPIGFGQTISQPFVVASMTEHLRLTPQSRVLEVGTGSAYQTAILAEVADEVFTIEVVPDLAARAKAILDSLDYSNVRYKVGDGALGWPDEAPFDGIIVTAAAATIPELLIQQLGVGGRMIIPVRSDDPESQDLVLLTRTPEDVRREALYPVRFVPLRSPQ